MYTIEITSDNGISKAYLIHKFPFDDETKSILKGFKQHADFSILLEEIKGWNKYLNQN